MKDFHSPLFSSVFFFFFTWLAGSGPFSLGERRELNPRMVDSQSTALIHLATSAPPIFIYLHFKGFFFDHSKIFVYVKKS